MNNKLKYNLRLLVCFPGFIIACIFVCPLIWIASKDSLKNIYSFAWKQLVMEVNND